MRFTSRNKEYEDKIYDDLLSVSMTGGDDDILSSIRKSGIDFKKVKTASNGNIIKTAQSFFELKSFIDLFSINYGDMEDIEGKETELKPDYMLLQYTPDEALVRKSNHDIWAIGKLGDNIFKITRVWDIANPIGVA